MSERKIIVIDDEEYICQSCRELLGEEGYEVKTFIHPLEGLKQLREESFDLLLLDLKMPEPTNTPSTPSCIIRAASAGVAKPECFC